MSTQLRLIDTPTASGDRREWRLDEQTRTIGRNGIAAAREALRQSRPRYAGPDTKAA